MTLQSLLTMSSAFAGSDNDEASPGNKEKMYSPNNWVKFALDLLMADTQKVDQMNEAQMNLFSSRSLIACSGHGMSAYSAKQKTL